MLSMALNICTKTTFFLNQGRNPHEYSKMVNQVVAYRKQLQIQHTGRDGGGSPELSAGNLRRVGLGVSVEMEKTKPELAALMPLADVVR